MFWRALNTASAERLLPFDITIREIPKPEPEITEESQQPEEPENTEEHQDPETPEKPVISEKTPEPEDIHTDTQPSLFDFDD